MQSNNVNFVTDGSKVYRLAGNEWYVVEQDDEKVMLVDTDCKIGDEEPKTPWSDGYYRSKDGENGQCILNYTNSIAVKYFSDIKYAIIPRTVEAGTGKLEDAYMWPMSYEEFSNNKVISDKITLNFCRCVWTRTFIAVSCDSYRDAWYVNGVAGCLSGDHVRCICRVAPAFYLKKSAIDHINDDGEIILKPADTDTTN